MLPAFAALLIFAQDSAVLSAWTADIEQRGGGKTYIARVEHDAGGDTIRISPDTPGYPLFAAHLRQEKFVRELMAANALLVRQEDSAHTVNLVFLNTSKAAELGDDQALLAHELGHAWLQTLGYPSIPPGPRVPICLAVHASDAVQHVLIRAELAERAVDAVPSWIRQLDRALEQWKSGGMLDTLDACQTVRTASTWIDVRLGLTPAQWPGIGEYEKYLAEKYPEIKSVVDDVASGLAGADLASRPVYRQQLEQVAQRFARLYQDAAASATPLKIKQ